ncbi:hypothetical protein D3C72_2108110 [compost metagenome]
MDNLDFAAQEIYPLLRDNEKYLNRVLRVQFESLFAEVLPYLAGLIGKDRWYWAFGLYYHWKGNAFADQPNPWVTRPWKEEEAIDFRPSEALDFHLSLPAVCRPSPGPWNMKMNFTIRAIHWRNLRVTYGVE